MRRSFARTKFKGKKRGGKIYFVFVKEKEPQFKKIYTTTTSESEIEAVKSDFIRDDFSFFSLCMTVQSKRLYAFCKYRERFCLK